MNESMETAVNEEAPLDFKRFDKLPSGVQRVVIAVIFVIALVLIVVLRELLKSEEMTREAEESSAE